MWAFETTFYQIYPIGFCGVPRVNEEVPTAVPATAPAALSAAPAAQGAAPRPSAPIRKIADWAEYLQKLGIGAVILNPVFESDSHGYDTRDLTRIDRRLGTNADFAAVCATLRAHGVRTVLDAVFNHVGRGFWAFQDVRAHGWESRYRDWFIINFEGDSAYGDGFWYEGWEGHFELVKLNLRNPEVVDYLLGCVRTWREEFGIDGLRLDVAYSLDRDFLRRLHGLSRELAPDGSFVLIGETLHGDYNQLVNDEMLDSCTNYECYKGLYSALNARNMFEIAHSLHRQFGPDPWCIYQGKHLLSFADNHDVTRLASILTDPACVRPAYGVLFGMPGIPCLYYGSEWGATGSKGAHDDFDLRPCFDAPTPNDLTAYLERLIAVRAGRAPGLAAADAVRAGRALCYGGYRNVHIASEQLLFERACEGACALVAVNAAAVPAAIGAGELVGSFAKLLDGGAPAELDGSLELAPYEVCYLVRNAA